MIIRSLTDLEGSSRDVKSDGWRSFRLLLKDDNMGFSFHITMIEAGAELHMEYKNHLESVYCIQGKGTIESVAEQKTYPIEPGTIYALDKHDKHVLRATTLMTFACVFNPPCTGREVHDESGAYPLES